MCALCRYGAVSVKRACDFLIAMINNNMSLNPINMYTKGRMGKKCSISVANKRHNLITALQRFSGSIIGGHAKATNEYL